MSLIINEWQLGCRLNTALQHQQRADFSLWLALLSSDVREMAEFCTPDSTATPVNTDLYRKLAVRVARSFGMEPGDPEIMYQHTQMLHESGTAALKLESYLKPAPWVLTDDKYKLPEAVWQNISVHGRRKLTDGQIQPLSAEPAALYEVLQQLHAADTVSAVTG
ncbi:VC2046/SO_2500 family protein [Chromatiaceae bacterium AAb-1]|nr:VC2046/SO_2500 family protein [Chromatiaceae bacterium AAb-1]